MKIKKANKLISYILVIVMMTSVCTGCEKKTREKTADEIYLYYANKDHTKLVSTIYKPKESKTIDKVDEVLEQMNKTSKKLNIVTAKPENVKISNFTLYDKTLTIDFSTSYNEMSKVTELLCRSAIVLTITQLSEIDYVLFTVEGQPLSVDGNEPLGSMKAEDFVDDGDSNINSFQSLDVVLYYASSDGKSLLPTDYSGVYYKNTSLEKLIIEQLIKGPKESQYQRTLPSNIKLLSVLTKDGICYVNFDSSFLTEKIDISPELEIYSIVNSLAELSYINKVQISINGETNVKFKDSISLEYTFTRNLDLVK